MCLLCNGQLVGAGLSAGAADLCLSGRSTASIHRLHQHYPDSPASAAAELERVSGRMGVCWEGVQLAASTEFCQKSRLRPALGALDGRFVGGGKRSNSMTCPHKHSSSRGSHRLEWSSKPPQEFPCLFVCLFAGTGLESN